MPEVKSPPLPVTVTGTEEGCSKEPITVAHLTNYFDGTVPEEHRGKPFDEVIGVKIWDRFSRIQFSAKLSDPQDRVKQVVDEQGTVYFVESAEISEKDGTTWISGVAICWDGAPIEIRYF